MVTEELVKRIIYTSYEAIPESVVTQCETKFT